LVHRKEKGNIPEDFIPTARFYGKISKSSDLLETFLAGKLLRSAASLASAPCRFSLSDETVSLPRFPHLPEKRNREFQFLKLLHNSVAILPIAGQAKSSYELHRQPLHT